jgi:hypothetical protein
MIIGFTDAAIKRWPYSESNPNYVLSCASLIFGSVYVDHTNVFRVGLDWYTMANLTFEYDFPGIQHNTASVGFNPCLSACIRG